MLQRRLRLVLEEEEEVEGVDQEGVVVEEEVAEGSRIDWLQFGV
jgi:hypothetical protein